MTRAAAVAMVTRQKKALAAFRSRSSKAATTPGISPEPQPQMVYKKPEAKP